MITLACTNCKTVLTMDEAFAGGVCRCQHCGTIQTVPSHLKHGSAAAAATAGQAVGASKSLYQQSRAPTDAASGLESLGDAVTSSGLGSARLKSPGRIPTATGKSIDRAVEAKAASAKNPLLIPLLIAIGAVVVLGIVFAVYMMSRSSSSPGGPQGGPTPENPGGVPVVQGPSFLGTALKGKNFVYILDRGNSDYFDGMKQVVFKSLQSLGADRTFQVLLTNNGDPPVSVPPTNTWSASDTNIQQVQDALRDVVAGGASTIADQLADAVRIKPDGIILVTAKSVPLTDEDAAALQKYAKAGVPLYLFEIGSTQLSEPLLAAAGASGGSFHSISSAQLDNASK